jgi:PTH1 family peptidyl-tRNA hydrolase
MEENKSQFIIVGLGNPGREFRETRHNIGFMLLNRLAERLGIEFSRMESKSLVTKGDYRGHRLILAKPMTYMNLSGQAVSSLVRFYKITLENLLVAYDDVDLPLSTLRLRPAGGAGGHKGLQSIIQQIGTPDFPRLRLGIGRPPGKKSAASYVLKDFSADENEFLPVILDRGVDAALTYVTDGIDIAMNNYNSSIE